MDERVIVTPQLARRIALAASVSAHAMVAGLWIHASQHKATDGATSRPRAAMTVRLFAAQGAAVALPLPLPPPLPPPPPLPLPLPQTSPAPKHAPRAKALHAKAAGRPAPQSTPVANASADPAPEAAKQAPPPDPAPPAAVPGAAFAGLFAPIISRPMGQSAWRRRSADPAPTADPQVQREQALLALRMSLLGRLTDLADRLVASGQGVHCNIAIDDVKHTADVQCADPADQGAPWSALQGLLVAGTVAATDASLCFSLVGTQVTSARCAEEVPTLPR